eukprot:TRINITY_DN820_c0_g1_i15.p1 TRINITY_DN820_c0_g1~~TRINITY_DN820_c0_g1_i15.p1  ORF type:complete len:207 (+),score=48.35 TRINITY_DN820_c0_g1_i15:179-799(+)
MCIRDRYQRRVHGMLGEFELSGIPMAPRGVPQIDVTFDIDANGILHVSAKDKQTGRQQAITIKSSGGLSESDVQRMLKEAEQYREHDVKRKEMIELKNESDSLIYQIEKDLREHKDKVPQAVQDQVKENITKVNELRNGEDTTRLKEAIENLKNSAMEIGRSIYKTGGNDSSNQTGSTDSSSSTGSQNTQDNTGSKESKQALIFSS